MPKTKAVGLYGEKDINLVRAIKACMARTGKNRQEIAKKGDFSEKTHYNRLSSPGEMKISELRTYIRLLDIPEDDVLDALYLDRKKKSGG